MKMSNKIVNKDLLYMFYSLKTKHKIKLLNLIKQDKLDSEEYEDIPVIDKTIEGIEIKDKQDNTAYELRYNKIIMAELLKGNINNETLIKLF